MILPTSLWLGINLSSQGKFEEAHAILQSALKLDPNNHVILFNSALPASELGKHSIAEENTKLGLTIAPNYYLNWSALYRTYKRQVNKESEIKGLIQDLEQISNKDRNIYDVLVHYNWKKDEAKYQSYLSAARTSIKNETRGEHTLDFYMITEGKIEQVVETALQRFNEGKFDYGFGSNLFISEVLSDERIASFIKKTREGKD